MFDARFPFAEHRTLFQTFCRYDNLLTSFSMYLSFSLVGRCCWIHSYWCFLRIEVVNRNRMFARLSPECLCSVRWKRPLYLHRLTSTSKVYSSASTIASCVSAASVSERIFSLMQWSIVTFSLVRFQSVRTRCFYFTDMTLNNPFEA